MNIDQYLTENKIVARQFAAAIGVPPPLVSQWRTNERRVPAERCPDIERATNGQVTCEELRPDVDWAYLRKPSKKAA